MTWPELQDFGRSEDSPDAPIRLRQGPSFSHRHGHDHKPMQGVAFQETLIRGTEWAATGKVSFPPVSEENLPADEAIYRDPKDIKPVH